ncbi:MAG: permease prefix domain 1-containing protein [Anaerolineae bacterium]|nr:permease prefix domain 1-containing protein [Anaerolineae bacterium]
MNEGPARLEMPIDRLLAGIRTQMDLDGETEQEVMAEIRDHLEEAFAEAQARGLDDERAWAQAAARFGLGDEVGRALHQAHAGWGTADAVIAAALPVVCALVLRWLAFAPDGTALGWPQLLSRPAFWVVALVALLLPVLKFERWRCALAAWAFFWMLTVLFVALPAMRW